MDFGVDDTKPGSQRGEADGDDALRVSIIYDDVRSAAEILRISSGGLFAKTGLLLQLGDQVDLEFSYGAKLLVQARAQVSRIEPQTGSDEEIGVGLRYLDMDAKSWLKIEKHVFHAPTVPPTRAQSGRMTPASTSQRFRVLNQETDRRIARVLAEIGDLQDRLAVKYDELRALLDTGEPPKK
jgi:Tfp pilus assembly protein PilZ